MMALAMYLEEFKPYMHKHQQLEAELAKMPKRTVNTRSS